MTQGSLGSIWIKGMYFDQMDKPGSNTLIWIKMDQNSNIHLSIEVDQTWIAFDQKWAKRLL